ncbi:hypothetical protein [Streptomyces melanogenes]|uniref:hypothetical protein n=1 Tax=Streptomyces melanogenes TaxID=67326 RepID=UPI00167DFC64|nr:hypothetical protein [Streptomyces melanogenes]GGP86319.1 hypothetical protein GCM10010278_75900 [Streptomyces melanogenes]
MSEIQRTAAELREQYALQVTGDLERNAKEQERVGAELAVLQEKLTALRCDHDMLTSMRQTLSGYPPPSRAQGGVAVVPTPRQATVGPVPTGDPGLQPTAQPLAPTLVGLVRDHLGRQAEPRSTAEITAVLAAAHPARRITATVVRTALESLVARGLAARAKRGKSVFYSLTGAGRQEAGEDTGA